MKAFFLGFLAVVAVALGAGWWWLNYDKRKIRRTMRDHARYERERYG